MNGQERKILKARATARLKKTKAWMLVTMDGNEAPVFAYDISRLQDKEDIRHRVMHGLSLEIDGALQELFKFGTQKIEEHDASEKVADAKEKRSEELAKYAEPKEELQAGRTFSDAPVLEQE